MNYNKPLRIGLVGSTNRIIHTYIQELIEVNKDNIRSYNMRDCVIIFKDGTRIEGVPPISCSFMCEGKLYDQLIMLDDNAKDNLDIMNMLSQSCVPDEYKIIVDSVEDS